MVCNDVFRQIHGAIDCITFPLCEVPVQDHFLYLKMQINVFILASILILSGCRQMKDSNPVSLTQYSNRPASRMVVYQIMVRLFGNKESTNVPYGTLQQNGVGKFSDITDKALYELKVLGVTHIWYTGVIAHALITDYSAYGIAPDHPEVVKGRAGSPYAIKDYYDVNPDLADVPENRQAELDALIERTHRAGLKVIIDFVPNHVARAYHGIARPKGVYDLGEQDNQSIRFSPDNNFYYLPREPFVPPPAHDLSWQSPVDRAGKIPYQENPARATGNDQFSASPGIHDWFETIKLNYGVDVQEGKTYFDPIPNTWIKMKDILLFWAGQNVDGFRCDMAEMVPVEFWQWAIPQVKSVHPEIIFIAEIYNPTQYRNYVSKGGFDYLYDKVQLYDTLRLLIEGRGDTGTIESIQKKLADIHGHLLHFMENHDEQRIASRFFAGDPWKAVPAMVISATLDTGALMIYFGQEVGEPGAGAEGFQGDDGRTTIFDYWGVPEHQKWMNQGAYDGGALSQNQIRLRKFYQSLLQLINNEEPLVKGDFYGLTEYNAKMHNFSKDLFAAMRVHGQERLLIVAGFNSQPQTVRIDIPETVANQLGLSSLQEYDLLELLWNADDNRIKALRLELELPPFGAYIFKIR